MSTLSFSCGTSQLEEPKRYRIQMGVKPKEKVWYKQFRKRCYGTVLMPQLTTWHNFKEKSNYYGTKCQKLVVQ